MSGLYLEALPESIRLNRSSDDLFYFVLARKNAATLFTMDQRLTDLAMRNGLNCIFVPDAAPGKSRTICAGFEQYRVRVNRGLASIYRKRPGSLPAAGPCP